MKVYYAHFMGIYNTHQEHRDIDTLIALGLEVVNPNSLKIQQAFDSIKTVVPYTDQETHLKGFVAHTSDVKRPLVILCHAWRGRDEFINEKAELIANLGYVGFAIDMYGVLANSKEENAALKIYF